jgi:hypothetical protein
MVIGYANLPRANSTYVRAPVSLVERRRAALKIVAASVGLLLSASTAAGARDQNATPPKPSCGMDRADVSNSVVNLSGLTKRSLSACSSDVYNVRDYSALGMNTPATIGTQFPKSVTKSLLTFASQSTRAGTPYAWMMKPAFGLTFSMLTSTDQRSPGKTLTFLEHLSGVNSWLAAVATWQDPAHGGDLVQAGLQVRGSCIAQGTTVASVGRTPAAPGYGTITLSQDTSEDCRSSTPISFTIAPSQLQALTIDWLGIQSAMAAAWLNTQVGGSVYIPAGNYDVNHSLVNAGGVTDTNIQTPNLDLHGDGVAETRIIFGTDLGPDECAVSEVTRGVASTSLSTYHDFRIIGPDRRKRVEGVAPNAMDGICIGQSARLYNLNISNMRAGVNGLKDHWSIQNSSFSNNGYGVYLAPYTSTMGNQSLLNTTLAGNTVASVGVSTTDQVDSATITNVHTGFGPYGFYREPLLSNVLNPLGFLSNTVFDNVWIEAVGRAWIYGVGQFDDVDGNTFIGGGYSDVGSQPLYAIHDRSGGVIAAPAVIYAGSFTNNVLQNTNWSAYHDVTDAIIEVEGSCTNNLWLGDEGFVFHGTATVSALICPNGLNQDRFLTGMGNGIFRLTSSAVREGEALYDDGLFSDRPFVDGKPFAGIAASSSAAHGSVGVVSSADELNVIKADPEQSISKGQSIFATKGSVAGGLDARGSIGVAIQSSGSGTSTVWVAIDPGMSGGGSGVQTELTSTGSTQETALAMTSSVNRFTTVAAGSGAVLGVIPIGESVTIYNDGSNALLVYPQLGGIIIGGDVNVPVSLAAGTSAGFRRLSSILWHR